jgi:hypothetical protein
MLHEKQAKNALRDADAKFMDIDIFNQVMNDLGKHRKTCGEDKSTILDLMFKMSDFKGMTIHRFAARLLTLNAYLAYFPARP